MRFEFFLCTHLQMKISHNLILLIYIPHKRQSLPFLEDLLFLLLQSHIVSMTLIMFEIFFPSILEVNL